MSWLITAKQYIPAVIGEPFGGGFFAGYISHTADGNPTHALIVAPRATGATGTGYTLTTQRQWKTTDTATAGANSVFNGAANTAAIVTAGIADHPAAQFCVGLSIGGFTDWYLPAVAELNIAYFNLKPNTNSNFTGAGSNIYAVPSRGSNFTAGNPAQTALTAFVSGGEQFQSSDHWASSEASATNGNYYGFNSGFPGSRAKTTSTTAANVRAFRRIAL
jgi:hypothetical protein